MKKEKKQKTKKVGGWLNALAFVGKLVTAALVILVLFWFGFVCEVREGDCAVILRFGAVREEITDSGIYLKLPWPFETVVTYDSRLQYLETGDLEITTENKRNIIIQSYAVWQIEDPVLYHNSVGIQGNAETYIKEAIKSATNGTMGGYQLSDLVYTPPVEEQTPAETVPEEIIPGETVPGETIPTDTIPTTEVTEPAVTEPAVTEPAETVPGETLPTESEEELPETEVVEPQGIKIDQIQAEILARVQKVCLENYGISVTDVSILRLSLPATNLDAVFSQMKAERQKAIDKILADAQLAASQITLSAAEESAQIIADGVTEAAKINAKTESEVARIYAEAQSANIELYRFLMSMDTYINSVDETTILVVKADEYPFNILTEYSRRMTADGDEMVISDLTYILSQLPETERATLVNAISRLIAQSATRNQIPME